MLEKPETSIDTDNKDDGSRWQPLADFAHQGSRDSGLKAWLAILEGSIRALEKAAWQGREMTERALYAWRAVERGAGAVGDECKQLAAEARRWPSRLKRLSKTAWVLTRIMSSYRLWGTRSAFLPKRKHALALEELHRRNAGRFRDMSLQHGGAFLKIGQLLSCRQDLLPPAWVEELAILQDQAQAESWPDIAAVIESEFGEPVEQLFATVDTTPLAAASIGQVHRAELHSGQKVVIKVQRPGLAELVELDMMLLKIFLDSMRSSLPAIDLDTIIEQLQHTVRNELDYLQEAHAMTRIGHQLSHMEGIYVPQRVPGLCSKRVLTCEWVEGEKLSHFLDRVSVENPDLRDQVMRRLLDAWLSQLFHGGLIHADPHPGNILVDRNGGLLLLDFGATQALTDSQRQGYFRVMQACVVAEYKEAGAALMALGFATENGQSDTLETFASSLMEQVRHAILQDQSGSGWPTPAENAEQVNVLMTQLDRNPLTRLPAEFIMLARIFAALGGLFMHYQPNMDLAALMMNYLTQPLDKPQQA